MPVRWIPQSAIWCCSSIMPYLHLPKGLLKACVRETESEACGEAIYIWVPCGKFVQHVCGRAYATVSVWVRRPWQPSSIFYFHPSLSETRWGKWFGCGASGRLNDKKETKMRTDKEGKRDKFIGSTSFSFFSFFSFVFGWMEHFRQIDPFSSSILSAPDHYHIAPYWLQQWWT